MGIKEGVPRKHTQSVGAILRQLPAAAKPILKIRRGLPSKVKIRHKKQHAKILQR